MSRTAPTSTRTRVRVAAGAAALITVACTASAAALDRSTGSESPRPAKEAAALTGSAKLYRPLGDDITFTFDAHLAAEHRMDPAKATGTFRFSHYLDAEGAWAEGRIDCLLTGGKVAVATGVITDTDLPGAKGNRVGFTVHDVGRHDRLGYSWASVGNPIETKDLPKCVSSAPFEKVKNGTGDFRVLPWEPDFTQ
ncbi:hypothetical protein M2163_008609 [Streptomyces sp. SAI-135]|jgi:hypothetical protein|uniref:hypothetical protein n=1 Tax=unclassified Streptomyces TaxID=2593676 RepID=UPI002474A352|nr:MULTISPECIES: hypothetical protein [unclassified Streptomyces]MDH6514417.1 hypothetical protein [Streptomyces sp. SAI-090]MDH6546597.1 hypothetical protein [Streptomyces sp. SAI-041]MDH6565700.1 hypothetical protein [Streptomyces sp. SAI-117]MDH6589382.1 hypothetical protein [Streptomyces sp. SAI-133]MDH6621501.1 hypothetical protein [Streptomyces sp. SAI-135]